MGQIRRHISPCVRFGVMLITAKPQRDIALQDVNHGGMS